MKHNKERRYAILTWIAILLIVVALVFVIKSIKTDDERLNCPYKVEGNASFTIKYVDSPYCIWCWLQEPILSRAVEKKGNSFTLERYDIRYCKELVDKYKFSATPSFVFSIGDKEFTHIGYIQEDRLDYIICEVTGNCAK